MPGLTVEHDYMESLENVEVRVALEQWPFVSPFRITGHVWESVQLVLVTLSKEGCVGSGEAAGIYYKGDQPASIVKEIESLRPTLERGICRDSLQTLLPPCGARNALDCALWDLEAKLTGRPAWQMAGLSESPRPLVTTFTCGADTPDRMAQAAERYYDAKALKLKLTGEDIDADRVLAVREARPDVWLAVDANQGFTRAFLEGLMPTLIDTRVSLIEQPFRIGEEALLDGFRSPIPVAADESAQTLADLPGLVGRFNIVNIKLDKCGGLTEGLAIARAAREHGLEPMVGNMLGTSLAMAPAFIVGQLCKVADLDGPVFLSKDRPNTVEYRDGMVTCSKIPWG